jgi:hypothetical protein
MSKFIQSTKKETTCPVCDGKATLRRAYKKLKDGTIPPPGRARRKLMLAMQVRCDTCGYFYEWDEQGWPAYTEIIGQVLIDYEPITCNVMPDLRNKEKLEKKINNFYTWRWKVIQEARKLWKDPIFQSYFKQSKEERKAGKEKDAAATMYMWMDWIKDSESYPYHKKFVKRWLRANSNINRKKPL